MFGTLCPGYPGILSTMGLLCLAGLPRTILDISGYSVPWGSMPGGTTGDCPGYPGILSISGSMGLHACMAGLLGTDLGIPGYLVSRDPWDSMPGGTTWDCPGYPGILSISGSMGLHAWLDYSGLTWVSRDT